MKIKLNPYLFLFVLLTAGLFAQPKVTVSGKLVDGYRVLTVQNNDVDLAYTVYRGDYIKFKTTKDSPDGIEVGFPSLGKSESITGIPANDPYFKMKTSGDVAFTLNGKTGVINVLDYVEAYYTELNAQQTATFINERKPLVLDVRTPREYAAGHLKGSTLIPVQELQRRIQELKDYKEKDILVYCRSGNRSTVASNILIDAGFKQIYNLRSGILGWSKAGYPIEN